jgi:hypothetical protein
MKLKNSNGEIAMEKTMNAINNIDSTVSQLANNTATLSSSAMLVTVNVSKWEGRKFDKKASNDIVASNNAERGAANVHKKLLPNSDAHDNALG